MSLVNPPDQPMANARLLLTQVFSGQDSQLLVHHGQVFRRWIGTHWPTVENGEIDSIVWKWLEDAEYFAKTKDGWKRVPFKPSRAKVAEIVEAMEAITFLTESVGMPSWIG